MNKEINQFLVITTKLAKNDLRQNGSTLTTIWPVLHNCSFPPDAPKIAYPGGTSFQATLGASYTLPCPVDALPDATNIRWKRVSQAGVETYLDMNDVRYSGSVPSVSLSRSMG